MIITLIYIAIAAVATSAYQLASFARSLRPRCANLETTTFVVFLSQSTREIAR